MAETENTRLLALEVLVEVEKQNIFAKDALHKLLYQKQFLSKQDRAFITRLVEGTTEYQTRLDYVINLYSKTKVNKCKPLIRCVLRMGVYQMLYMDSVPNGVACNECVKLAKKKGFHNLTGFVNGVLRSVERNIDSIPYPKREDGLAVYLSVQYSIPQWLVERFLQWYEEEQVIQILEASLQATGITIRVNDNKISRQELAAKLEEQGMDVEDGYYSEDALHVSKINYVNRIPGFRQGEFFIQDESSMLLYPIANIETERKAGQVLHILDLCAAPGGKCTHFAQKLGNTAYIEARDVSERKTALIKENRERLGLSNMEEKVWDALILDESKKEWA
ncbi:MAG TPA: 16S rRNA (cytosine(967)-C(5))-methyltransferase, partial [Lachnospiraceae bacterium]|nr:16S rRNA (cytosine(967)-C(5))-methyltransferase [Lachnospiraceae bacterium]